MLKPEETLANETETEVVESATKKDFIEPEVSVPVDVLEATTFFAVTSSGATN